MIRSTRHMKVGIAGLLGVLAAAVPVYAASSTTPTFTVTTTPDVVITEFQTNGGVAAQEFVELYNTTDQDIVLGDPGQPGSAMWQLQFFNSAAVKTGAPVWATTASITNSIALTGTISAHDYFIIASTGYQPGNLPPDVSYAASSSHLMTDTGGGLQLLSATTVGSTTATVAHDRVMWLDAAANNPLPSGVLASPASGKSQQRLPNADNEYVDSNSALTGFSGSASITPLDAWQAPLPVAPVQTGGDSSDESVDGGDDTDDMTLSEDDTADSAVPEITELLPNPASPSTDAADEFIEVYNPGIAAFDLEGYSLEVGTTTLHDFTFAAGMSIPARSYRAFYSADTHLSLSNSGGQARLLDSSGVKISETGMYGTAVDNQSWSVQGNVWQWSTTPTPNAANIVSAPAPKATKAVVVKKAATKAAAKTKGATTTKKAKAKVAAKKKKAKKTTKTAILSSATAVKPRPPIHSGVLVGVAVAAVLYGLYEYRHDIADRLRQLRGNRAGGGSDGNQTAWR